MMHATALLGTALVLSCAACAIIPYSVRTSVRPSLVAKAHGLVVGMTTMEDVLLEFGEPEEYIDGASPVFRYRWARERGVVVGVGPAASEVYRETSYALRIEFDNDLKVHRFEVEEIKGLRTTRPL